MSNRKWSHNSKGMRKTYEGGASPSPENTLGAKDKNMSIQGMPSAEKVDQFQVQDKRLDKSRANQPNMPVRRTSVGDAENDVRKK